MEFQTRPRELVRHSILPGFLVACLLFALPDMMLSQGRVLRTEHLAGDMQEIRSAVLNANNISVSVFNYGQLTRPAYQSNVSDFVWHGLGYMFEFGPLFAAEVVDTNGQTVHVIDDGMRFPSQGGYSPDGVEKWGWLPRAGYVNSNQEELATLRNPASWPESWLEWPGIDGSGTSRGVDEAYYVMDDFTNREFAYYPFPDDSTKRGLGISAQVWVTECGPGMPDAAIVTWRLKNESTKDLTTCYFGFYGDPHVGGAADYADDLVKFVGPEGLPGYPDVSDLVYTWDPDMTGMGGLRTAFFAFRYIQTPGAAGLTGRVALPYTPTLPNVPKNREFFWDILSGAENGTTGYDITPGDYVIVFGTGPFSLAAGDSIETSVIIFFSESYEDMLRDASYLRTMWRWTNLESVPGARGGYTDYAIDIPTPAAGGINGTYELTWNYTGTDPNALVLVEVSRDGGVRWDPLNLDIPVSGSYQWNTTGNVDGVRYLLRAVAYDSARTLYGYAVTESLFEVDNPSNAQPEVIFQPIPEGEGIYTLYHDIAWRAFDADDDTLSVVLSGSLDPEGPFMTLVETEYLSGTRGAILLDASTIPNTPAYYLRITVSDGVLDSSVVAPPFAVDVNNGTYEELPVVHLNGVSTAGVDLQVADVSKLTEDEYEVTFAVDGTLSLSVRNLATGTTLLSGYPVTAETSTPAFDGVKLRVTDTPADVDTTRSGFTRPQLDSVVNFWWSGVLFNRQKTSDDWLFVFNSLDTLSDGSYATPGDSAINNQGQKIVICPFHVYIDSTSDPALLFVRDLNPKNGKWDSGEPILLLNHNGPLGQACYQVNIDLSDGLQPTAGDSLWVRTFNPLTSSDVYRVTPSQGFTAGIGGSIVPVSASLDQNYPNPFNPSTTISYRLTAAVEVRLVVFDLLGREVCRIVDQKQKPGSYRVLFDASTLPTGIYFYRLSAGELTQTKRMVLLR